MKQNRIKSILAWIYVQRLQKSFEKIFPIKSSEVFRFIMPIVPNPLPLILSKTDFFRALTTALSTKNFFFVECNTPRYIFLLQIASRIVSLPKYFQGIYQPIVLCLRFFLHKTLVDMAFTRRFFQIYFYCQPKKNMALLVTYLS